MTDEQQAIVARQLAEGLAVARQYRSIALTCAVLSFCIVVLQVALLVQRWGCSP